MLIVSAQQSEQIKAHALNLPSLTLNQRQLNDLEMLLLGAFAPLQGFLGQADYLSVLATSRLADGQLWPIPVMLDIGTELADQLQTDKEEKNTHTSLELALRDGEGLLLAVLDINDIWQADLQREAEQVFGTLDPAHPGVAALLHRQGRHYIAGKLLGIQAPLHYSFTDLWLSPAETRQTIQQRQWPHTIAFQTTRIIHRVHHDLLLSKAKEHDASLLLHPSMGQGHAQGRAGSIDTASRVHCYQAALKEFPPSTTMLALSPLTTRLAGPRETLWHALIEKNYGASHFLVGPDDSSPRNKHGEAFCYAPEAAQTLLQQHQHEIGIESICVEQHVYDEQRKCFAAISKISSADTAMVFREEQLCEHIQTQQSIPDWWSFESVVKSLTAIYKPLSKQGFTVFFTGLSGSGKSTIANIVNAQLIEIGSRPVTLLDGDIVRLNLSNELGFSRQHRDINVRRIGFVANEITKNGGVAICAPIAPYSQSRKVVREQIEASGGFIEIHVSTPLDICESRDRKGLYAKARKGIIPEFTGISDPYEIPDNAELSIDTSKLKPLDAARQVMTYLAAKGYINRPDDKQ